MRGDLPIQKKKKKERKERGNKNESLTFFFFFFFFFFFNISTDSKTTFYCYIIKLYSNHIAIYITFLDILYFEPKFLAQVWGQLTSSVGARTQAQMSIWA
jgi:hypothetical protein